MLDRCDAGCVIQAWVGLSGREALAVCMWAQMTPFLQDASQGVAAWAVRFSFSAAPPHRDVTVGSQHLSRCTLMRTLLSKCAGTASFQHV